MIFNIAQLGKTEIARLKDIVSILAKYGFGEIFQHIPFPGKLILPKADREYFSHPAPQRLRIAIEELGTTFIKLGQFAAARPDIVPSEYITELSKLHDEVTPVDFEGIEPVIIKEWGADWRNLFSDFDEKPVASASISQVYKAVLKDAEEVAVKIQRADTRLKVNADMQLIFFAANFIEKKFSWAKSIQLKRITEEFSVSLRRELDFRREAILVEKFRRNHSGIKEVLIPGVFKELSRENILVLSFIHGRSFNECCFPDEEKRYLAKTGVRLMINQILKDGLFHADPHDGNLMYTDDGRISYLDFGMVGRLSPSMRSRLIDILLALYSKEPEWILQEIIALGDTETEIDTRSLVRDIMEVTDRHIGVPLSDISIGNALVSIFDIIRRYNIMIHPAYAVVAKTIIIGEGLARKLDPGMDVINDITGQLKLLALERYRPSRILLGLKLFSKDIYRFFNEFPSQLREILRKVKAGHLEIEFKHVGLENLIKTLDLVSVRLTLGVIVASLIIGSAIITVLNREPMILGVPVIAFAGFIIAGVTGIPLLISIMRKEDR